MRYLLLKCCKEGSNSIRNQINQKETRYHVEHGEHGLKTANKHGVM